MSRHLDSQYRAIKSPWPDHAVYSFPDASCIGASCRQPLMEAMNDIIAVNWNANEPHWTATSSPFDEKYSLILIYHSNALIAFSVYRVLNISGGSAIYRSGTEVLPAYQGRGFYGFFTSEVLRCTKAADTSDRCVLYGWRTRNPIVWAANAKICKNVTPSLLDDATEPSLQASCVAMCSSLYPGQPLELPGMIMRGAYGHIKHHRQAYHGTASLVDAAMSRLIPNLEDAVFSVGYARI